MNSFTFREGNINDKEQLMELFGVSYGVYSKILSPENSEKLLRTRYDDAKWITVINTSKTFVCTANDEIIGMAFLVSSGNPWDIFKEEWSYIRLVGVHPNYNGKGIAKQLIRMCIHQAASTGEKTIALHTSEFMDAARHIYESLGFKVLHEIEPRFDKRYWLYTLEL